MKKILFAAFLVFSGILTTGTVHAQMENQQVPIPKAPPAVLQRIAAFTTFLDRFGIYITQSQLYVYKGIFLWVITTMSEQNGVGQGSFSFNAQGETVG